MTSLGQALIEICKRLSGNQTMSPYIEFNIIILLLILSKLVSCHPSCKWLDTEDEERWG